jgi:predicted metal-dependent phosphoesterase TrpH
MDRIDLHAHTRRSDGSLEPRDLVELAARTGLRALAITDHDTTAALDEAEEAGKDFGVEVLTGAEISARFPERAMHLLAYGFDRRDPRVRALLAETLAGRERRNPRIVERLCELGVPVTLEEVRAEAGGEAVGRPHIARALVRRGHAPDVRTAFQRWLKDGGPAYVPAESVAPADVIAAVGEAGGVVVLAHPKQLRLDAPAGYETLLSELAAAGLAGVEVMHPSHDAESRALFAALAARLGLVASGGSDFHGEAKPDVRLGYGKGDVEVGYETWEALSSRRRPRGAAAAAPSGSRPS